MTNISIKLYESKEELRKGFEVLKQLRTHLNEESFFNLYEEMQKQGYQLFGLEDRGLTVAVAGVSILTNFYNGRHVFVYDLVTDESKRSNGYGKKLLDFISDFGRRNGCQLVTLQSGVQRINAHRFYEHKMEYEKLSYSFSKVIEST
ncbi:MULTISPECIES: GNAT family N-acetyltransferase [Bacillaceae]|uniref:GNAT family N-acetyltransferase n=1 Tax=Gottfriedia luciferensis TaxID=178774 RepID=A0ABX2ZMZ8_9BACI|nr:MULTISPECIES: GNAT family N-acetyltransferase [Bacillaceae]ODG89877.1 GNAT family N-acetyltransferase [Gottfriedia luciferensis]SFC76427.1 Acetyltransferase (GNAT) family protein [Bacillus sp. UNCCL81]